MQENIRREQWRKAALGRMNERPDGQFRLILHTELTEDFVQVFLIVPFRQVQLIRDFLVQFGLRLPDRRSVFLET